MILFFLRQLHFVKIHEIEAHHRWWSMGSRPLYCPYYPKNIRQFLKIIFKRDQETTDSLGLVLP